MKPIITDKIRRFFFDKGFCGYEALDEVNPAWNKDLIVEV